MMTSQRDYTIIPWMVERREDWYAYVETWGEEVVKTCVRERLANKIGYEIEALLKKPHQLKNTNMVTSVILAFLESIRLTYPEGDRMCEIIKSELLTYWQYGIVLSEELDGEVTELVRVLRFEVLP